MKTGALKYMNEIQFKSHSYRLTALETEVAEISKVVSKNYFLGVWVIA